MRLQMILFLMLACSFVHGQAFLNLRDSASNLYSNQKFQESLDLLQNVRPEKLDSLQLADYHYLLGINYQGLTQFENALDNYLKSENISYQLQDSARLVRNYIALAQINKITGDLSLSQKYYEEGMKICPAGSSQLLVYIYDGLGQSYLYGDELNKALEIYNLSHSIYQEQQNSAGLAVVYINLGLVHNKLGDKEKALKYYQEGIQLQEELGLKNKLITAHLNIGKLYHSMDSLEKAKSHYLAGLQLTLDLGTRYRRNDHLFNLVTVSNALGDTKASNKYFMWFSAFTDSLIESERKDQIQELQVLHETVRTRSKLQEQELLTRSGEKLNLVLILAIVIVVILAAIIVVLIWNRQKTLREKEQRQNEVKSMHRLLEGLDAERQRIAKDLHDDLGANISLAKLIYNKKDCHNPNEEEDELTKLLDVMAQKCRGISHNLHSGVLEAFGLGDAVEDLISHVENSGPFRINFTNKLGAIGISKKVERNVFMIIQELVNNFLKHANSDRFDLSLAIVKGNTLLIEYCDYGLGFNKRKMQPGLGMENIDSRVNYLKGTKEVDGSSGVRYNIRVPLQS